MRALLDKRLCIQHITRPRMGKKRKRAYNIFFINQLLFIITLAPLPLTSQIPHPLHSPCIFTRCCCSFPSCPGHCMTVHSSARSKLPRQNMMNDVRLFSRVLVLGNSVHIDKRQSIQLRPPHTGTFRRGFSSRCTVVPVKPEIQPSWLLKQPQGFLAIKYDLFSDKGHL